MTWMTAKFGLVVAAHRRWIFAPDIPLLGKVSEKRPEAMFAAKL